MDRYFLYDPEGDGMQVFATVEARDDAAAAAIKLYLGVDGWGEDVERVLVGEVTGRAAPCDVVRPDGDLDDECIDESGVYWGNHVAMGVEPHAMRMCNYRIATFAKDGGNG